MKKVLTILLTLVMAIGLVSLNNRHINAEGTTYIYKTSNGTNWDWETTSPGTDIVAGDTIRVKNSSGESITLTLIDGSAETIASQDYVDIDVKYNVTTSDIDISTPCTIKILDGIKCTNLTYDSNNGWKDGGSTADLNKLGITMNGTTAKFSKNIYNSNTKSTIAISSDLKVVINNNILFVNTNTATLEEPNNKAALTIDNGAKVTIDGTASNNNYSLTLKAGNTAALNCDNDDDDMELKLNNIKLVCESTATAMATVFVDKLNLGNNCEIIITNKDSTGGALWDVIAPAGTDKYDFFGKDSTLNELKEVKRGDGTSSTIPGLYYYNDDGDLGIATHIVISPKSTPTPSPEKSKGEMSYDKNAHGGAGAFVLTVPSGHATSSAIAYFKDFEDSIYNHDHVLAYDGYVWQVVESGWGIETNSYPVTSNGEKYTKITFKKELLNYLTKGINYLKITLENEYGVKHEYYVDITVTDYIPPTPGKDESCEKVIGPTWHWNNDKGICEDYGVVGTSTR